jgi:hypothetical protein
MILKWSPLPARSAVDEPESTAISNSKSWVVYLTGNRRRPSAMESNLFVLLVVSDQPVDLWRAQLGHLAQQGPHCAAVLLAQREVSLLGQDGLHPSVLLGSALSGEFDLSTAAKKVGNPFRPEGG